VSFEKDILGEDLVVLVRFMEYIHVAVGPAHGNEYQLGCDAMQCDYFQTVSVLDEAFCRTTRLPVEINVATGKFRMDRSS